MAESLNESDLQIPGFELTPENYTFWMSNCSSGVCIQQQEVTLSFPPYIRLAATTVCAVILALGTAGNVLVAVVVCTTKELRNSTNLFLINLSVADLLVLLVCVPPVLVELHSMPEVWLLGEGMCKAVPYVEQTAAHGSILTILAISFERYYAICQPLKAGYTCTKMRAVAIIIVVWIIALVVTSPVLATVDYKMAEYMDGTLVPVCLTLAETRWQKLYYLSVLVMLFLVPFLVLLVVYMYIAKHLMLDSIGIASSSEESQMRARRQVVFMLIAVVLSFFICLLPFRVFMLWIIVTSPENVQSLGMEPYYNLLYFCRLLLYMNSALNPILYNVISSKFRNSVLRLLKCRPQRKLHRQITKNTTSSSTATTSGSVKTACHNGPLQVATAHAIGSIKVPKPELV